MNVSTTHTLRALLVAALLSSAGALPATAAELSVELQGVRASSGLLKLAVVDARGWDGQAAPLHAAAAPPQGASASFSFKDLAPGRYAVMVTHDENGNGKLDSNLIGMPIEGYGFSNNPRVMRKPTFEEASFEVGEGDLALTIELR